MKFAVTVWGRLRIKSELKGFGQDFLAATLFYQRSAAIARQAIDAISLAGVPVLLLKGISLASRIYTDPGERPMSDIDLLVPSSGHADASAALRRLGYWIAGPAAERGRFHHATTFKRRAAAIDLHRSIVQPLRRGATIAGLWDRARPAGSAFPYALIADPIDETLLVMTHIARHELVVPAIGYVDGYRLLMVLDDEQRSQLFERAARAQLRRGLEAVIAMTDLLATDTVCPQRLRAIHRSVIEQRRLPRSTQLRRKLSLLDSPAEAMRLALGSLLEKTGW